MKKQIIQIRSPPEKAKYKNDIHNNDRIPNSKRIMN